MDLIGNKDRILSSFSDIYDSIVEKGGIPTDVLSYADTIRSLTDDAKLTLLGQAYNGSLSSRGANLQSVSFTMTTEGLEYFSPTTNYSHICKKECDVLIIGATYSQGSASSTSCGIIINNTTYNMTNYYTLRCKNYHINVDDVIKPYASISTSSNTYVIALEQIYLISK